MTRHKLQMWGIVTGSHISRRVGTTLAIGCVTSMAFLAALLVYVVIWPPALPVMKGAVMLALALALGLHMGVGAVSIGLWFGWRGQIADQAQGLEN